MSNSADQAQSQVLQFMISEKDQLQGHSLVLKMGEEMEALRHSNLNGKFEENMTLSPASILIHNTIVPL